MLEKGPMSRDRDRTVRSDEHNSRGIELADRGWLDEAIKEFKKAIELDPESAHAHDNLATVYSEKKLYREALKEYLTALELEPDSATAHYNLACFLATHASDMAVDEYKEAIELDPDYPDAHLDLGICYAQKGFYAEAERCYGRARELNPDDVLLNYNVAALYSLWEKPAQAFEALKKALEKDPAKVRGWIAADPMFDALKGDPQFEQILAVQ